jgi:primary-amine oxidase
MPRGPKWGLCLLCMAAVVQSGTAEDFAHPLDPLNRDEILAAYDLLKAAGKLPDGARFASLALQEPAKSVVQEFRPGNAIVRKALAGIFDVKANASYEAEVDLTNRRVAAFNKIEGVEPLVLMEEYEEAARIVRSDERWQAAMQKRGITKLDEIQIDVWAPGHSAIQGESTRVLRALSFLRGDAVNSYARPIEGVVATVDMIAKRIVNVSDTGLLTVPKEQSDFFSTEDIGPTRPAPKPLVISQPDGPSFEVRGHEIRWQGWRFRCALHPREGLVLYQVGYEQRIGSETVVRPILYRASLSEMVVPYGDPSSAWSWRSAFDQGEYGMGRLANSLRAGQEVPENSVLMDATFADDRGQPYELPRSIALYERDGGLLWTHFDVKTGRVATRRARQLVMSYIVTIGNYDYGIEWTFHQDGALDVSAVLSGILLVKGVAAQQCEFCRQTPDEQGRIIPVGDDRYGRLVGPNVLATNHQHFFSFRLDFDVDGVKNRVLETNVHAAPVDERNPFKNGFIAEQTQLRTEADARRDMSLEAHRTWKVYNPNVTNRLGHFPGYKLEPGVNSIPYVSADTTLRKRAGFVDHHFWATAFRSEELYAAGTYPNQNPRGDGIPKWTGDGESLDNADVVVWYTFGVTHVPRAEEWPVMPATHVGFRLLPDGFFDRSAALDVPAEP